MDSKLNQALFSGVIATSIMSLVMYLFSKLGLPEVHPPVMLSDIMSISSVLSWMLHFSVGVIFALFYMFFFEKLVINVNSKLKKGLLFGATLFIVAQIAISLLAIIFKNVSVKCEFAEEGRFLADHTASMLKDGCSVIRHGGINAICMTVVFCLIGHLCYGVAVVYTIFKPKEE